MQGYAFDSRPTPAWDLDAFASAGGIRSTAGDMLTYLEAQLHPERSPFAAALVRSQRIRDHVADGMDIALAWMYDLDKGVYWQWRYRRIYRLRLFQSVARFRRGGDVQCLPGGIPF